MCGEGMPHFLYESIQLSLVQHAYKFSLGVRKEIFLQCILCQSNLLDGATYNV